jgi:hypothetical protein
MLLLNIGCCAAANSVTQMFCTDITDRHTSASHVTLDAHLAVCDCHETIVGFPLAVARDDVNVKQKIDK